MKNLLLCSLLFLFSSMMVNAAVILERGPAIWVDQNGQYMEVSGSARLSGSWEFLMYSPNTTVEASALDMGPRYQIWQHYVEKNGNCFVSKVYQFTSNEIGAIKNYPCFGFFQRYKVYLKQIFVGKTSSGLNGWILLYDSKADINGDEKIDWQDVEKIRIAIQGQYDKKFDMNDDFFLTNEDIIYVYNLLDATPDLKAEEAIPFITTMTRLSYRLSPTAFKAALAATWGKIKVAR